MKYITFVVPSYNSQDYLHRCVDTLIPDNDEIEIIIVNDGSTDKTAEIADAYAEKYPNTIRVVHKENGGHGSAVNTGLSLACGQYLKVVDSDDWLDDSALKKLLLQLKNGMKQIQELTLLYVIICMTICMRIKQKKWLTEMYLLRMK